MEVADAHYFERTGNYPQGYPRKDGPSSGHGSGIYGGGKDRRAAKSQIQVFSGQKDHIPYEGQSHSSDEHRRNHVANPEVGRWKPWWTAM
jgi:hypothetical protein